MPVHQGGVDGKKWNADIPINKLADEATVWPFAVATLGNMNGAQFSKQLTGLQAVAKEQKALFASFDREVPAEVAGQLETLEKDCVVTKFSGVLVSAYIENNTKPNPSKLRRVARRRHEGLEPLKTQVNPAFWAWCEIVKEL